jgi:hypothetical protein
LGGEFRGVSEMYEEGFDVKAVAARLRSVFAVEQGLPFEIDVMLTQLRRAEAKSSPRP